MRLLNAQRARAVFFLKMHARHASLAVRRRVDAAARRRLDFDGVLKNHIYKAYSHTHTHNQEIVLIIINYTELARYMMETFKASCN